MLEDSGSNSQNQLNSNIIDSMTVVSEEMNDELLQNNSYIASESSDYGEDWAINSNSNNSKNGSDKCNLIINYLPHSIDDAALLVLFSEFIKKIKSRVT